MRWFARQSNKNGRVCAFNQYFKLKVCDNIFNCISEELNVNGNVYEIMVKYLNYKNNFLETLKKEYESNFIVY